MKPRRQVFRESFRQFLSFSVIGTFGFLVDAIVLSLALTAGLGFYFGRIISFLTAATFTWYWNRRATFRSSQSVKQKSEWLRFLFWNTAGGAANFAVYAYLIGLAGVFVRFPVLAVAAGSLAGLTINFLVSKWFVFRRVPDSGRGGY